jgi:hypothetical protein
MLLNMGLKFYEWYKHKFTAYKFGLYLSSSYTKIAVSSFLNFNFSIKNPRFKMPRFMDSEIVWFF